MMSLRDLERAIVDEARTELRNPEVRLVDLLEWSTSEDCVRGPYPGAEVRLWLPVLCVWAAFPLGCDKRPALTAGGGELCT